MEKERLKWRGALAIWYLEDQPSRKKQNISQLMHPGNKWFCTPTLSSWHYGNKDIDPALKDHLDSFALYHFFCYSSLHLSRLCARLLDLYIGKSSRTFLVPLGFLVSISHSHPLPGTGSICFPHVQRHQSPDLSLVSRCLLPRVYWSCFLSYLSIRVLFHP